MEFSLCSSKHTMMCKVASAIIGVIILGCVAFHIVRFVQMQPNHSLYQVVLLDNDQAFFGKLHAVNSAYPYLTDVYYLKPTTGAAGANGQVLNSNQGYNVIKRGSSEIHGPTDRLYLNRASILYWENVGPESLVAKGIKTDKEYKETGKAPEGVNVTNGVPTAPAPKKR